MYSRKDTDNLNQEIKNMIIKKHNFLQEMIFFNVACWVVLKSRNLLLGV